jgi:hypothetical protein
MLTFRTGAGFIAPKQITSNDFENICETFKISLSDRPDLRRWFDGLVSDFVDWMHEDRRQPDRRADRDHIGKALKAIRTAASRIDRLGPSGREALKPLQLDGSGLPVGSIPSRNEGCSRQPPSPRQPPLPRGATGPNPVMRPHSAMTVRNALKEIEDGLIRALGRLDRQRGARGGRERNVYRDYLLINLAIKWAELGREVTTGPKSEFVGFSESVANAIGWPTKGIDEAVRLRSVSDAEWLGIKAAAASRKSRR